MPQDEVGYSGITPQVELGLVPNLRSHGMRPYLVTGFLVQHFRNHFASGTTEEPSLRSVLWSDDEATGIVIDSITRWDPHAAGARPAILVRRGEARPLRRGIGDSLMGDMHPDGLDRYATFIVGSHVVLAIGSEAGEAERLGSEVYRELLGFGPVLRCHLGLHRFVVSSLGELRRVRQEDGGGYAVPVAVEYAYEESWTIQPHVPILQGFPVGTQLDAAN